MSSGQQRDEGAAFEQMTRPREVVTLHLGQAGVQAGSRLWELYCLEHGIDTPTAKPQGDLHGQCGIDRFFQVTSRGHYLPRALMIDTDPSTVGGVMRSSLRSLFGERHMVGGDEDTGNNFARGFMSSGKALWPNMMKQLRRQIESTDSVQGFVVQHSIGGGTGSGFGAYMLQELSKRFGKKDQILFSVFPSSRMGTATVEPYNALLFAHFTSEGAGSCCFLTDNEAAYTICTKNLELARPTYADVNRLLAQAVSTVTSTFRFKSKLGVSFRDIQTNLMPTPRLRYPLITYAPIVSWKKDGSQDLTTGDITNMCFAPSNHMLMCDTRSGQYLSLCLVYRGDVSPRDVNNAVSGLLRFKGIRFADWIPNSFKVAISDMPPSGNAKCWGFSGQPRAVVCLANTTAIRGAWAKLANNFEKLLAKRAFVHWYTLEGLELADFNDALEFARELETDYKVSESP